MSDERAPGTPGAAYFLTIGLLVAVIVGVYIYPVGYQAIVNARGIPLDLEQTVMSEFDGHASGLDPLSVTFVRNRFAGCVETSTEPLNLIYSSLVGWHGMGIPTDKEWSLVVKEISELCASSVVLSSVSMQDARDRNQTLEQMEMAPFSSDRLANLSFK
jgi:hypothetical protein